MTPEELRIKQAMEEADAANAQAKADADAAAAATVAAQAQPETPAVEPETPATEPTELQQAGADLDAAQTAYDQANNDMLAATQEANKRENKLWSDYINEQYARQKKQEQEMKQQEQANMMSSMATGTTELAANIINMLSVGQLHASNQQYKSYPQDWMRKADQDNREHRHRHENLQATMDRLKQQQDKVRTAGRIEEMKLRQQQAAQALAKAQDDYARQQKEAEKKAAADASMLAKGFRPDPSDPSGYRFDPNLARQMAVSKSTKGIGGSGRSSSKKPSATPSAKAASQPAASQNNAEQYSAPQPTPAAASNAASAPANAAASNVGNKDLLAGGFKDYAYRIPNNEKEWERKRNVYGWEENPYIAQAPDNKVKRTTEDDWAQYKV